MREVLGGTELLAAPEADRRITVATALTQLDLIKDASMSGQLQSRLLTPDDGIVGHHFLRDIQVIGVSAAVAPQGAFALHSQRKGQRYGDGRISFEIDGSGEDFVFMVGPWLQYNPMRDMFDPANADRRTKHIESRDQIFTADEFLNGALPFATTDIFTALTKKAYKFTRRHLPTPPQTR